MPVLTQGQTADVTFVDSDSITIQAGSGTATFERPIGTVVAVFSGTRTFGPFSNTTGRVTATVQDVYFEFADGNAPQFALYTPGVSSGISAAGAGNMQRSAALSRVDYDDNAAITENWANLTSWTLAGTPGVQVSGNKLYSTGSGGAASGGNRSFALAAGENLRAVFNLNYLLGGSSGGIAIGVSSDAAGATPTAGAGAAYGLYFRCNNGTPQTVANGAFTDITGLNSMTSGAYVVTVTVDQQYITVVAKKVGGTFLDEIRTRRARAGFTVGNLYIFNSDTRGLTGMSLNPSGARKQFGTVAPRTGIEDTGQTAHWSGDATSNFKLTLPTEYDTRKQIPLCIMLHGNGSNEHHFSDNSNGFAASSAVLSAGFAVLTHTVASNTSTWGNDASLNGYLAAYKFFRDRYNLGPVLLYGNSMGALESLLMIALDKIPGVVALAVTHPAANLAANYANPLFTSVITTAYGITAGNYAAATANHDPALLPASKFKAIPVWVLYSTDDTTVVPADNIVPFLAKLQQAGNSITTQTTTGGHSAAVSSFMPSMVSFYNAALGL